MSSNCAPIWWTDSDGNNCRAYLLKKYCTSAGQYGPDWGTDGNTFFTYKKDGYTAINCAECGCTAKTSISGKFQMNCHFFILNIITSFRRYTICSLQRKYFQTTRSTNCKWRGSGTKFLAMASFYAI